MVGNREWQASKNQVTSVLCTTLDSCYWHDLYSQLSQQEKIQRISYHCNKPMSNIILQRPQPVFEKFWRYINTSVNTIYIRIDHWRRGNNSLKVIETSILMLFYLEIGLKSELREIEGVIDSCNRKLFCQFQYNKKIMT